MYLSISIWFGIPTVPIRLSLMNGHFVPHNPISGQGALFLVKVQMIHRLQLLMSSGPKKMNPDMHFLSLSKFPENESHLCSPTGAPMWKSAVVWFCFTYPSNS